MERLRMYGHVPGSYARALCRPIRCHFGYP
jgi:hypothetical protein